MFCFAAPGPPENLICNTKTQYKMILIWNPPSNPHGAITGYVVCRRDKVYADMEYGRRSCEIIKKSTSYNASPVSPGVYASVTISPLKSS